jgi:hypothetical protein
MNQLSENAAKLTGGNLIFIVGAPRSGTTWLQRLLATHPQIQTGQESRLFEYVGHLLRQWAIDSRSSKNKGIGSVGMICYLTNEEFFTIQKNYLAAMMSPMVKGLSPGQFFLEKTPSHALFIPEIMQVLPQARIIHIIRDPRDVIASLLAASRGWGHRWAPRHAKKAANLWCRYVAQTRNAKSLVPAENYLEVSYEKLCANPKAELRSLATFLKFEWSDEEIAAAITANTADVLRENKGTQIPLHGEAGKQISHLQNLDGFVRKARPGTWREDLTLLERWQVWRVLRKSADAQPFLKK